MPETEPRSLLEYKIGRIKKILANIETPGWIETWPKGRKSMANKLILRETGVTKYATLLDTIRPIRQRLEKMVLPKYQRRLKEFDEIDQTSQEQKTPNPLVRVPAESPTEFMKEIGYDPGRLDDSKDLKSFFIRRGFSVENRAAFHVEYTRIHALWAAGKLPGILSETEIIEVAAILAGG